MTTSTSNTVAVVTTVVFGSVGTYKNQIVLVRGITKCGKKLQLLNLETGDNLVGYPSINSVSLTNAWPTGIWNGVEYCYSYEKDILYTASGVAFKEKTNPQRQQLIRELFTYNQPLAEMSCEDMIEEDSIDSELAQVGLSDKEIIEIMKDVYSSELVDTVEPLGGQTVLVNEVVPEGTVVEGTVVEGTVVSNVLEDFAMFTAVSVDTLGGVFTQENEKNLSALKTKAPIFVNGFNGSIKTSNNGKFLIFVVKPIFAIGLYNEVKFLIEKEAFDVSVATLFSRNIHVAGVSFKNMKLSEEFAVRTAIAMTVGGIGFKKVSEGINRGLKVFCGVTEIFNLKTGKTFKVLSSTNIQSVGPLSEGQTGKFISPVVIPDTEFGQNVADSEGNVGRLVFESPNKVVAREMKLGAGKTEGITKLGKRSVILIDEALNPNGIGEIARRMLVLGTAWVSPEEYTAYGSIRLIPLKAVTAPMPRGFMELSEGMIVAGGNSHKSKLNGVLVKAMGFSHSQVSQMDEVTARQLLEKFIVEVKISGRTIRAYCFEMELFATNFYSLYSLEGNDIGFSDDEDEFSSVKSFFMDALAQVEEYSARGELFNLSAHIADAIEAGEISRKARMTEITSAEVQQVGVSYGFDAGKMFVDELMTRGNVRSKYFLFENAKTLPRLTRDQLFNLFTIIKGDIEPTLVPEDFMMAYYDLVGDESKGFACEHKGYLFPFAPVGNVEFVDGMVKDAPASLVAFMNFGVSLRNKHTLWDVKYANHMAELNGNMLKKVQVMKVPGTYLAAVGGFWLKPTEIFSMGDNVGKVTSAKLPILFDQSITGLTNVSPETTPYSEEELRMYAVHFDRIAFVSPEYFMSQENDGDGDLVKVMKPFKSIPLWTGQPNYAKGMVDNYIKGEYESLKLSLKPYKMMKFTDFDAGNWAARTAKDNVALMAANEYRTKQLMMPFMTSGSPQEKELSGMVAEASAYLVQYEAMRAAKHDGAVSNYYGCKCAPNVDDVPTMVDYINNWSDLLKTYFGYESTAYDYVILHKILAGMKFGVLNGLCPIDDVTGFVMGGKINRSSSYAFALQQKGFARAIGGYAGAFCVPTGNDERKEKLRLINQYGVEMFRLGGMFSTVFNGVAPRVARGLNFDVIASQGDVFSYFLMKLSMSYNFVGPLRPKGVKAEVKVEMASAISLVVTAETTVSAPVVEKDSIIVEENVMTTVFDFVDAVSVWEAVKSSIVVFVNDDSMASNSRMAKLKRSVMAAANNTNSFELAVIEAESYVMDYNDWASDYLETKELDTVITASMEDSVLPNVFPAAVSSSCVNVVLVKCPMPVRPVVVKVVSVIRCPKAVRPAGEQLVVVDKPVKAVTATASVMLSESRATARIEVASKASKLYEGMVVEGRHPDDFSTGELSSMKYETRRASIEAIVNGDKPSKVVSTSDIIENGNTAFYSDYDAYTAFMSDNCG